MYPPRPVLKATWMEQRARTEKGDVIHYRYTVDP